MVRHGFSGRVVGVFLLVTLGVGVAWGQPLSSSRPWADNVIAPQARSWVIAPPPRQGQVTITGIEASVEIRDQVAVTTIEVHLRNQGGRQEEAELIMPAPDGAVIRSFTYEGAGNEGQAEVLPREEARRIYDGLVARTRDPALLEFVGYNLVRSSVFPVPPRGTQWVRLVYEHVMDSDGDRVDYVLPRSESLSYEAPWTLTFDITMTQGISTVYSSSHGMEVARRGSKSMRVTFRTGAADQPGAFRLSIVREGNGVTATMFRYPDPKVGGGYFLLLAGLPAEADKEGQALPREVTLVIDRSGSMEGEKIDQARTAALQVLSGLREDEKFNVVVYSSQVEMFSEKPVLKTAAHAAAARRYIKGIQVVGGTNIHDALVETLRQPPSDGYLPVVLFLTDGLPTVGNTSELAIREMVEKGNKYERRVFTFGVGLDVNAPLLEHIAEETRATTTFVLPDEDIEVKVGRVFEQLYGPVLVTPELRPVTKAGDAAVGRVRDVLPARLPDLFEGDQLVVLGQYVGEEPLGFELRGEYRGAERGFRFDFDMADATTRNAFVPRLWASRKIAMLVDEVRRLGADARRDSNDPKVKELVDEIVRLSVEFGILTEYTAFLAREGSDVADAPAANAAVGRVMEERAMRGRSGRMGVVQSLNMGRQKGQTRLNADNSFWNEQMERVEVTTVQQVNDLAFFRRGKRWVDSRLVQQEQRQRPQRVIDFGSGDFFRLVDRLAQANRQGTMMLDGEILLEMDGETILIRGMR